MSSWICLDKPRLCALLCGMLVVLWPNSWSHLPVQEGFRLHVQAAFPLPQHQAPLFRLTIGRRRTFLPPQEIPFPTQDASHLQ